MQLNRLFYIRRSNLIDLRRSFAAKVQLTTVRLINFRSIKHFQIADLMNKICMNIKASAGFNIIFFYFKTILMNFPDELYQLVHTYLDFEIYSTL